LKWWKDIMAMIANQTNDNFFQLFRRQ
jgi:hypothetical protein